MQGETPERLQAESPRPGRRAENDPPSELDQTLIAALASYLSSSRNRAEVREAIRIWRNDVVNAGLQPERLLIDFKHILLGLKPAQQSLNLDQRVTDRREVIAMCIEEYYR